MIEIKEQKVFKYEKDSVKLEAMFDVGEKYEENIKTFIGLMHEAEAEMFKEITV